jgi:hypothetical protein
MSPEEQRQLAADALAKYTIVKAERPWHEQPIDPSFYVPDNSVGRDPVEEQAQRVPAPLQAGPGKTWATPGQSDTPEVTDDQLLSPDTDHQKLARDALAKYNIIAAERPWHEQPIDPSFFVPDTRPTVQDEPPRAAMPSGSRAGTTWAQDPHISEYAPAGESSVDPQMNPDIVEDAAGNPVGGRWTKNTFLADAAKRSDDDNPVEEAADTAEDERLAAKGLQRAVNAKGQVELRPTAAAAAPAQQPQTFQEASDNYGAAATKLGDAQKREAETEARGAEGAAEVQDAQAAEQDAILQAHLEHRAQQQAHVDHLQEQFRAMNEASSNEAPPEYKETTRSKVAGALALVGAAIADGFHAMGGNYQSKHLEQAQASIDKGIEQELHRQKEKMLNGREAAKAKGLELQIARAELGNTPEADEFARTLIANKHAKEVAAQASTSKSEFVRAAGDTLAADTATKAAKDQAVLMERELGKKNALAARAKAAGGGGGMRVSAQQMAEDLDAGKPQTPKQIQLALAWKRDHRGEEGVEAKAAGAEAKANLAATKEREEIVPGFTRLPNQRDLSSPDIRKIADIHSSAVGVAAAANEAARVWDIVMDPKTPEPVREKARADYERARNDVLSAVSVATGQGTITKSDAERTSGAVPVLPLDKAAFVKSMENWAKGTNPGAHTLRRTALFIQQKAEAQLGKTWGVVPKGEADKAWADWDAKQNPKPAAASGKAAAPAGKVPVVRVSDGVLGYVTAEQAKAAIASGKFKAAQ